MTEQITPPSDVAWIADNFDEDGERFFRYYAHPTPSGRTTVAAAGHQRNDGRISEFSILIDHEPAHGQIQDLLIESIGEAEHLIDALRLAISDAMKAAVSP